jgi:SAM-dependent methyltransferase
MTDKEIAASRIHVLSIAEGFFQSSVLYAMLKLNIFEIIGEGSKLLKDIAEEIKACPDTLARLLNAGVNLDLLESKDGDSYRVSDKSRPILLPLCGDSYLGNFIRNMDYFRLGLSMLDEAVLKSGPTIDPSSILGNDPAHTREFTLAMHNNASFRGKELANFLDTADCKTLLDIGCGPGTYSFYIGTKNPDLSIYLSDLPETLEIAEEVEKKFSLKNDIHYLPWRAGDSVEGQYDIILVSNTLHMLGENASRDLIKNLYKSISPGGSLVIQAQFLQDNRMGNRWPVYMDLIQLCVTSEGRNHTVEETMEWLKDAGFEQIKYNPMSILNTNSFLRAYKP